MRRNLSPFAAVVSLMLATLSTSVYATTWNEPWMDKVIRESDHLVLARVVSFDEKEGAVLRILGSIAGAPVEGEIKINGFYLLEICSMSGGHGPEFHFEGVDTCYFFLKKNEKGGYSIATPTTGYAVVQEGNVIATYRHSYHLALVTMAQYEGTMMPIFNYSHGLPYDPAYIDDHIRRALALPPAELNLEQGEAFFAQHIALETIHHLRLSGHYAQILPFLHDTANFHNQVSAARALMAYNSDEAAGELMKVVADTTAFDFVRVLCIWTLREYKRPELKQQLRTIALTASEEMNGFGGRLMDPRVCTYVPSVRKALDGLIAEL